MASILPFSSPQRGFSLTVSEYGVTHLHDGLRQQGSTRAPAPLNDTLSSLPELLVAPHAIRTHYDLGGERYSRCICGHVEPVFLGWPTRCSLQWVIESKSWLSPDQWMRDLRRTLAAGAREEQHLATLLAAGK